MAQVINDANFAEILASPKPVVIDFWATWCGPCRVLAPTVEEVAEEMAGKAIVAKCNVDDCEDISIKYGIRNIPTLIFIKNGEVVDIVIGEEEITTSSETIPRSDTVSFSAPEGRLSRENLPSMSVMTPTVVPLTSTYAPGRGSPSSETTVPDTFAG